MRLKHQINELKVFEVNSRGTLAMQNNGAQVTFLLILIILTISISCFIANLEQAIAYYVFVNIWAKLTKKQNP